MPTPTVWIVTRRPKRSFVGVAGGMKGAEDLAVQDAEALAKEAFGDAAALTWWSEHGEAPEPGKKFTRASIHFAQVGTREPRWTQTYDCAVHDVYQRPTPKKSRSKKTAEPELVHAAG